MEIIEIMRERKTKRLSKILYKIKYMLHPKKRRRILIMDSWMLRHYK